jgi:3-oxoacid CoA-transferase subunit A
MKALYPEFLSADMVVFASPIYYFTLSAQLQAVIHRTYAFGVPKNVKQTALILSSGDAFVYHEAFWHGGIVYFEDDYPNLLFAKDGEIYDLDGQKAIAIGGAYSVDKYYRLQRGMNWFPDEQPSEEIKQRTEMQLSTIDWNVDVVLSHTCPQKYVPIEAFMPGLDQSKVDHSTEEWLDTIEDRLNYRDWFCGHWHIDKRIDKMHFLMHGVEAL